MYKVILYGENTVTHVPIEVKVKSKKEPIVDNVGILIFYGESKKVAEFSRSSWQYWEEIDEET